MMILSMHGDISELVILHSKPIYQWQPIVLNNFSFFKKQFLPDQMSIRCPTKIFKKYT